MVVNADPSTEQHTIVVVCIMSSIASSISVVIRLWTRIFVTHSVAWNDYIALLTLPFCIACSTLVAIGTNYGFGWHIADVSPSLFTFYNKWIFILSFVYLFALGLYKFTILLLYLRLFGVNKHFRYITWAVMFFVFGYLFTNLLTMILGCTPIDKYWKATIPGHCIPTKKTVIAFGAMNVISDVIIFILPLPMVWRLQLSRGSKIGVTLVFMGGLLASVVAVVRYALLLRLYTTTDKTWHDGKNLIFMVLEVNTGLICSCLPAFKPFFEHLAHSTSKSSSQGLSLYTKNNASLRGQSDTGPLRQSTGDRGFVAFKDGVDIEMNASLSGASEIERKH